jgi:hypothetical protein
MALEDHSPLAFHTGSGPFAEDDVSGIITGNLNSVFLSPLEEIFLYFGFVL